MAKEDFHKLPTILDTSTHDQSETIQKIPKLIGPYRIESLLEKGGMSILYLGTHPDTKEPTTVKILLPKFLSHPDVVKRFLDEAEIIAMADHPNIVKLYGYGEWEGGLYIAMEFIEGISLRQYILRHPLSLKLALEMVIDIAFALCHLHTHGVIHRDLKPENILITNQGVIKVIDFGIAQLLQDDEATDAGSKQRVIGTPIYMSPEQRHDPDHVSYPSDIYSLGIIAYELILGKLSHGRLHLSLMPKGIQPILSKALQPQAKARYCDVVDFISDLSDYMHSTAFKQDSQPSDQISEISESLRQVEHRLLPAAPPIWNIGPMDYTVHHGTAISGLYIDFHPIGEERYGILTIEPTSKGLDGVINTAVLRGVIKTMIKEALSPVKFVSSLNEFIIHDTISQEFLLHYLVLDTKDDTMNYVSCGPNQLWYLPKGQGHPQTMISENPPIGEQSHVTFNSTTQQWQDGDLIVLGSFMAPENPEVENDYIRNFLEQALIQCSIVPPSRLVHAMLNKIRTSPLQSLKDQNITLVSIYREM